MELSSDSCREFLLYPLSTKNGLNGTNVDFSKLTHQSLVEELEKYLRYQTEILPSLAQVGTTHGASEQGIDLLTDFYGIKFKVGWQVKSWSDLQQTKIVDYVLAQVQKAIAHHLDLLVFILAGDPVRHAGKISTIISELSLTANDRIRIHVIQPNEFSLIFDQHNWNLMRGKAVSRIFSLVDIKEPDRPSMLPDSGPITPLVSSKSPASFRNGQAKTLYDDGLIAVIKGDLISAREKLTKAHSIEPNKDTYNSLGNLHLLDGKLDEALTCFKNALRLDPQNKTATQNMVISLLQSGLFDEASELVENSLKQHGLDPEIIMLKVKILDRMNRETEALALIKSCEGLFSPTGSDCILCGGVAYSQKEYDMALGYYRQFIISNPNDVRGPWGESLCLVGLGNLSGAIESIRDAKELDPENPQVLSILACSLRDYGCKDDALIEFEKASSVAPSDKNIIGNFANLLRDVGRPLEALEYYDRLITFYPYDPLLWENRGTALFNLGLFNDAYVSKVAALKVSKAPSAELINDAGMAAYKAGRYPDAIRLFKLSESKKPGLWHPKFNLARILMEKGFNEQATNLLEECLSIGEKSPTIYTMLASCHIKQNRLKLARNDIDNALTIDPNFPPAIGTLGVIEAKEGNTDNAKKLLEQAIQMDDSLDFAKRTLAGLR